MRDLKLITPTDPDATWSLDFDFIDGYPQYVQYPRNTQDQRAAVATYTILGSIPGKPTIGINWAGLYGQGDETLVNIDNEIKQAIQKYTAVPEQPLSQYIPVYENTERGIQITLIQG